MGSYSAYFHSFSSKFLLFCLFSFRLKLMSCEHCISSWWCNGKLCKIFCAEPLNCLHYWSSSLHAVNYICGRRLIFSLSSIVGLVSLKLIPEMFKDTYSFFKPCLGINVNLIIIIRYCLTI